MLRSLVPVDPVQLPAVHCGGGYKKMSMVSSAAVRRRMRMLIFVISLESACRNYSVGFGV